MARKRFSKPSFVTLACLFLIFAPVTYPIVTSAQTPPAVSQSTVAKAESKEKKRHPVRRFFSGLVNNIAGTSGGNNRSIVCFRLTSI